MTSNAIAGSGVFRRQPVLAFGLTLGILLSLLLLIEGVTGWYRDPVMIRIRMLTPLLVFATVGAAVWHVAAGKRWLKRLGLALSVVVIGAICYAGATYVVTGVLYPDYLDAMQELHRQGLVAQSKTAAEIRTTLAAHQRTVSQEAIGAGQLVLMGGGVAAVLFATVFRRKAR
jgi:hypothetical protein